MNRLDVLCRLMPGAVWLVATLPGQVGWRDPEYLTPRRGALAASDPVRGVSYLVGGYAEASHTDLWQWDGTRWQLTARTQPGFVSAFAFDEVRQRLVAVVNFGQGSTIAEFTGAGWVQVLTTPLVGPELCHDAARGELLLIARATSSAPTQTWRWDGSSLTLRATFGLPFGHAAFDRARGRVVYAHSTGTFEWDGSVWTAGAAAPMPLVRFVVAFDPTVGRVVAMGTRTAAADREQWEWDGSQWQQRAAGQAPPRLDPTLFTDLVRGELLLFGGQDQTLFGDTWRFDGTSWRLVSLDTAGPYRNGAAATQGPTGGLLLFGGAAPAAASGGTWLEDGARGWRRLATANAPPPRFGHAMATDRDAGRVYLFGGEDGSSFLGDGWLFDGTDWRPLPSGPAARAHPGLCFDDDRGRLVLYGGFDGGNLSDTWEFDGSTWTQRGAAFPPNDGRVHLVYDTRKRRSLAFVSGLGQMQTWEWDGALWYSTNAPTRPPLHDEARLAYDRERQRSVYVVPGNPIVSYGPGDTWEYDGGSWTWLGQDVRLSRSGFLMTHVDGRGVQLYGGEWRYPVTHALSWRSDDPARAEPFGTSCAPAGTAAPALRVRQLPWLGDQLLTEVGKLTGSGVALLNTGLSSISYLGTPLPFDLGPVGFPGCSALVGPESSQLLAPLHGFAVAAIPIPLLPTLLGSELLQQALTLDVTGALSVSRGLRLVIGQR